VRGGSAELGPPPRGDELRDEELGGFRVTRQTVAPASGGFLPGFTANALMERVCGTRMLADNMTAPVWIG
jgi:hypothetical protein